MERIATWLLTGGRDLAAQVPGPIAAGGPAAFVARVRDPFVARSRIYKLPIAIVCDALKIAYATEGRSQYKDVFILIRNLRKFLNFQIRLGGALGFRRVAPALRVLKSYWVHDGR
jgi:hypothetical protein